MRVAAKQEQGLFSRSSQTRTVPPVRKQLPATYMIAVSNPHLRWRCTSLSFHRTYHILAVPLCHPSLPCHPTPPYFGSLLSFLINGIQLRWSVSSFIPIFRVQLGVVFRFPAAALVCAVCPLVPSGRSPFPVVSRLQPLTALPLSGARGLRATCPAVWGRSAACGKC